VRHLLVSWFVAFSWLDACAESHGSARRVGSVAPMTAEGDDEWSTGNEIGQEGDETALTASPNIFGDGSPSALVSEVERELAHMRASSYAHRTSVDEATGTFDFDCSGFVGYALGGAAPTAIKELKAATAGLAGRPLAKHFEGFFESLPPAGARAHWQRVAQLSEVQPGDVVAWIRPVDVSSKNTGHVVIVRGKPTPYADPPGSFLVPIADSTASPHGRGDSRQSAKATGLGTGTLILVGDASGAPVAYRWSAGRRSRQHECRISMARLSP